MAVSIKVDLVEVIIKEDMVNKVVSARADTTKEDMAKEVHLVKVDIQVVMVKVISVVVILNKLIHAFHLKVLLVRSPGKED